MNEDRAVMISELRNETTLGSAVSLLHAVVLLALNPPTQWESRVCNGSKSDPSGALY